MAGNIPHFPRMGEPWLECPICGNDFPRSQMRLHYRKGILVDRLCDDERTHADYMEDVIRGDERPEPSEQRVSDQGEPGVTISPTGGGGEEPGGAGGGGAGGGGAGG